jgi:hypothetical protein
MLKICTMYCVSHLAHIKSAGTEQTLKDWGGRGGGAVNGSPIKFFARVGLCPKFKTPDNLCTRSWWKHFPTTEIWSQQNYEARRRRMESIGLTVSKLHPKQWSKVPVEKSSRLVWSGYQTCPVHTKSFIKFKSFFPPLILELRGTKIDEI